MRALLHVATLLLLVSSAVAAACDPDSCDPVHSYCDTFANDCKPCSMICHEKGDFSECEQKCENYLKDAIFKRPTNNEGNERDLMTLQIMLGVVTAVTAVTLLLVLVLVVLRVKGKKRKEKEVIPLTEFRSHTVQPQHRQFAPANSTAMSVDLRHGRSLQTMTTQLSEENSTGSNGINGRMTALNRSNGSSSTHGNGRALRSPPFPPTRLPSEDYVPDPPPPGMLMGGYDNRGMASSSSSPTEPMEPTSLAISAVTGSTLPPIQKNGGAFRNGGGPYTISNSQVV